jgi:hypothetical protein
VAEFSNTKKMPELDLPKTAFSISTSTVPVFPGGVVQRNKVEETKCWFKAATLPTYS